MWTLKSDPLLPLPFTKVMILSTLINPSVSLFDNLEPGATFWDLMEK